MALKETNKNRKATKKSEAVVEEVVEVKKSDELYSATDWIDEGIGVDIRNKIMIGIGVICFVLFFFV